MLMTIEGRIPKALLACADEEVLDRDTRVSASVPEAVLDMEESPGLRYLIGTDIGRWQRMRHAGKMDRPCLVAVVVKSMF